MKTVLAGRKDEQVRSYVEPGLKAAVQSYALERGMTPSQAMRKLIIDGLQANGLEITIAA